VFPKLSRDIDVDVVVIGAGIVGLTTAYQLTSSGRSVAVLERARGASIDSGHTSAHLTLVTDVRLRDLVRSFGRDHAEAVWDAGLVAIAWIDDIVRAHEIDCDFEWVSGYLHAPDGKATGDQADALEEDARMAVELGFHASLVRDVPFIGGPGVRFDHQARFHPRKYLSALAHILRERGVEIYEHSDADEFRADPVGVKANGHWVEAKEIVVATHKPVAGIASSTTAEAFQSNLASYTSYVVAGQVARGTVPDALFWDTDGAYKYLRIDPHRDFDLVILGGEDHKTGQESDTESRFAALELALDRLVPGVHVTHRWSGQVIESPDGLPYIGPMTDHQYTATGFAGNGLTFGTIAGVMIADAICGRPNPWLELFDPARNALENGLWRYVRENVDYPYYKIRDRFSGTQETPLRSIRRGEGRIIDHAGKKVAASRSMDGDLVLRSATCTHMGCLVAWNDAERTWDCPCHGSRFTPTGRVISGPAESPLDEIEPSD
jgi:glycine/D-amino acid oxidase-like deaminating enzyme/nitrite reductase/ring-hydroxylating ferredoxin subunit